MTVGWKHVLIAGALLGFTCFAVGGQACPWDTETYTAEAKSLPCVLDAVLGTYPKHSQAFYLARIRAADAVLNWVPGHMDSLDMKGVALLKLKRFSEAEAVMLRRAQLAPAAYASHANLGTLYTFTSQWTKALEAIDKALQIEPKAHFGREKYHRQLVVFLRDLQVDPTLAERENFLRIAVDSKDRLVGSQEAFNRAGVKDDAFDALVAMIAVYGADGLSHVYFALGEILALRGHRRLAWTAYQRAIELKHPRSKEIATWQKAFHDQLYAQYKGDIGGWIKAADGFDELPSGSNHGNEPSGDVYQGMSIAYQLIAKGGDPAYTQYKNRADAFTRWEEKQIANGLPVWRQEGLDKVYQHANEVRRRCKSPGVILNEPVASEHP